MQHSPLLLGEHGDARVDHVIGDLPPGLGECEDLSLGEWHLKLAARLVGVRHHVQGIAAVHIAHVHLTGSRAPHSDRNRKESTSNDSAQRGQ